MTQYPDGYTYALLEVISDATADSRVGSSVVLDTLIDEKGWLELYETLGSEFFDLLTATRGNWLAVITSSPFLEGRSEFSEQAASV